MKLRQKLIRFVAGITIPGIFLSCHTIQYKVSSIENQFYDYYREYTDTCELLSEAHRACKDFTGPCKDFCIALNHAESEFGYVNQALKRGGDISPQYTKLKKVMKEVKDAAGQTSQKK